MQITESKIKKLVKEELASERLNNGLARALANCPEFQQLHVRYGYARSRMDRAAADDVMQQMKWLIDADEIMVRAMEMLNNKRGQDGQ